MSGVGFTNWPQQRVKLMETHARHKLDASTLISGKFAVYLRAVGLPCSKQFFVAALAQLDPKGTGKILFSRAVDWFKGQCAAQNDNDKRYNRLLVKPGVGQPTQPTYNLPSGAHVYGRPSHRDAVGVGDTIFGSAGPTSLASPPTRTKKSRPVTVTKKHDTPWATSGSPNANINTNTNANVNANSNSNGNLNAHAHANANPNPKANRNRNRSRNGTSRGPSRHGAAGPRSMRRHSHAGAPKLDILSMNKRAVKSGLSTARQFQQQGSDVTFTLD